MKLILPAAMAALIAAGATYAFAQSSGPGPGMPPGMPPGQNQGPNWGPGGGPGWGPSPEMQQRWEQRRSEMEQRWQQRQGEMDRRWGERDQRWQQQQPGDWQQRRAEMDQRWQQRQGEWDQRRAEWQQRMADRMRQRMSERFAWVKQQLKLTPAQEPLFATVEKQVSKMMETGTQARQAMREKMRNADLPERLDMMAERAAARSATMRELGEAVKPLWATLSPEQKDILRRSTPGMRGGMMGGRGMGHGSGMGDGPGWGGGRGWGGPGGWN